MNRKFLFAVFFLILGTALIERSGLAWAWERPLLHFLATQTKCSLPEATAVTLPLKDGALLSQDVALSLRAMLSFSPRLVLVAAPLGDLSSGSFSLLREAQTTGKLQATGDTKSVPFLFAPDQHQQTMYERADVFFFPTMPMLTAVAGEMGSPGVFGFIVPAEKNKNARMPLFGMTSDGAIVASLWWQALRAFDQEKLAEPVFLLGKRLLLFPNNHVLWLGADACLAEKKVPATKTISLEDFLLRREEMERGQIRPDLDTLFRNKTVVIGGSEAAQEAALLQDAQQALAVHHLNMAFYGALLFVLTLGMMSARRFAGIDFLLILFVAICFYAGILFLLFRFFGILLPSLLPATICLIAFFKKHSS